MGGRRGQVQQRVCGGEGSAMALSALVWLGERVQIQNRVQCLVASSTRATCDVLCHPSILSLFPPPYT
jgi:hypothetical protein